MKEYLLLSCSALWPTGDNMNTNKNDVTFLVRRIQQERPKASRQNPQRDLG